jgi:TIR domain
MSPSVKVFISYAHEDESVKENLDKFLIGLKKSDKIEVWNDRLITGGTEWDKKIKDELQQADLILLIISVDFLNSSYIWRTELEIAMQRHENQDARVIPIIARSADWSDMPFRKLQGLPGDGKTISESTDKDRIYTDIVKQIKAVVEEILEKKKYKAMVFTGIKQSDKPKIFLSVATPHTMIQVNYINALKEKFLANGFQLSTLNDDDWDAEDPIRPIYALMKKSSGCLVLLLERYFIEEGKIKRGSDNEKPLRGLALTTPWNHIEATLAYSEKLPLLILKDKNVFSDGVFIDQIRKFKQVKIDTENFSEWDQDDKQYIFEEFIEKVKAIKK